MLWPIGEDSEFVILVRKHWTCSKVHMVQYNTALLFRYGGHHQLILDHRKSGYSLEQREAAHITAVTFFCCSGLSYYGLEI